MRWPQLKIKNKKTAILLICFGISAFFWVLIKLSKEYEITVKLPVRYTNWPKDKILLNKPDSVLLLKFTDNGFDLIPYSLFGSFNHINIDVNAMNQKRYTDNSFLFYTKTELLSERINNMLSSNNYISIIRPDSLIVKMDNLESRKIAVMADVNISLSPQFQLKRNVFCKPDSVLVFGNKKSLSSIESIKTEKLRFNNLNQSISETIKLIIPSNVKCATQKVQVFAEVEKFTESEIFIPLENNFKSNEKHKIFPSKLKIKYAVSFDRFNDVNPKDFKLDLSIDSLTEGRLNIHLLKYPGYVRIIDYSPKMAEYIIIK